MTRVSHAGVSIDIPAGWESSVRGGGSQLLSHGAVDAAVLHVASFPLPAQTETFGANAVELMNSGDILMVLFEHAPESASTPLFSHQGVPRTLDPQAFDREALQRGVTGQSGLQFFFTERSRAFCLYVVLGSHLDRTELVPRVNQILATLQIQ